MLLVSVSVIIPVADGDTKWQALLADLTVLSPKDEVILSSVESLEKPLKDEVTALGLSCKCSWTSSSPGRARQLNSGAQAAKNDFFWFLHADSKIPLESIRELKKTLTKKPHGLHFFNLKFMNDGPPLMVTNEIGAWIRSRILRLPFGDQGFCLSRETFNKLAGFNEDAPYGEDHLMIWRAHQKKITLHCVGRPLFTSARRYMSCGWTKTTLHHLLSTFIQASPQFGRLIKCRIMS